MGYELGFLLITMSCYCALRFRVRVNVVGKTKDEMEYFLIL